MNEKFIYKHFFLKYFLITLNPKYFNNDVLEIENCCPRNQLYKFTNKLKSINNLSINLLLNLNILINFKILNFISNTNKFGIC